MARNKYNSRSWHFRIVERLNMGDVGDGGFCRVSSWEGDGERDYEGTGGIGHRGPPPDQLF